MERISAFVRALDLRTVAAVLFGSIAIIAIIGIVTRVVDPGNAWFDLDSDTDYAWPPSIISVALPAVWSSLLFGLAGGAWIVVGWVRRRDRKWLAAGVFGALLLFLGLDELFSIHERIEHGTGLDWQLLYLPVGMLAAGLLVALAWWTRSEARPAAAMLVAAAASWLIALVLEYLAWRGDEQIDGYALLMIPEELLELAGTSLCILAAIVVLQSRQADAAPMGQDGPAIQDGPAVQNGAPDLDPAPDEDRAPDPEADRPQGMGSARSAVVIALTVIASVAFVWIAMSLVAARAETEADLFLDVYELTGSRLSGLVSMMGVALLIAAAAVALFSAWVARPSDGADPRRRFLAWLGLLTVVLAIDDYLAVHELADDVLRMLTGIEAERILKNVLELLVLGVYALLYVLLFWRYRATVAATEWLLLAGAGALLAASLLMDMAPHAWLAETTGFSIAGQDVVEDTLKLAGIALYLAYVTSVSASVVRRLH